MKLNTDTLRALLKRGEAFAETRRGQRILRSLRYGFLAGVIGWLAYQLMGIGWREVLTSLPQTPWFYLLYLVIYFQLPLIEALIYRGIWATPWQRLFPVLVRKRVLNMDVLNYSGEVYLFLQAQALSPRPKRFLLGSLKDNAIASGVASVLSMLLMAGGFLLAGQLDLQALVGENNLLYIGVAVVVFAIGAALAVRFRNTVFTLPVPAVAGVFGAHLFRFGLVFVLQVAQWAVVIPEAPLQVWATMLVIVAFTNRLPLIPAKDLAAAAAILEVSGVYDAYLPAIAGMLLVRIVLDKSMNLFLFTVTSRLMPPDPGPEAAPTAAPAAVQRPERAS
ncbi:MAG: hypothetical protein AAGI71_00450 [Bacteroidota bacterium]